MYKAVEIKSARFIVDYLNQHNINPSNIVMHYNNGEESFLIYFEDNDK